jgi:hypothetical protein
MLLLLVSQRNANFDRFEFRIRVVGCANDPFVTDMGRLVKLWKAEESEDSVAYAYGPDREHVGKLVIDKITGAVTGDHGVAGISAQDSWFFYGMLAKVRAEKMFKAREYPDEASIAT